jgi:histidine triad (HIT) family protein
MNSCIFCRIVNGEDKAKVVFEDQRVMAFHDINPQAPTHVLIIPRDHYDSVIEVTDEGLMGHLFTAAKAVAEKLGLTDYRLVINTGTKAGQSVLHLHLHLLGGRVMYWPPG